MGLGQHAKLGLAFNEIACRGELSSPNRENESMKDGLTQYPTGHCSTSR